MIFKLEINQKNFIFFISWDYEDFIAIRKLNVSPNKFMSLGDFLVNLDKKNKSLIFVKNGYEQQDSSLYFLDESNYKHFDARIKINNFLNECSFEVSHSELDDRSQKFSYASTLIRIHGWNVIGSTFWNSRSHTVLMQGSKTLISLDSCSKSLSRK